MGPIVRTRRVLKLLISSEQPSYVRVSADLDSMTERVCGEPVVRMREKIMDRAGSSSVNLFGLDRIALRRELVRIGEAPFRADQVMQWVYRRGVDNFSSMTNLGMGLRERLESNFQVRLPEVVSDQVSLDGTRKWALRLPPRGGVPGATVETVYIPEDDRGTLCISSQAGCAMDCAFCSTAQGGFSYNMSAAEIIGQVWFAAKALGGNFQHEKVISNVVFMGMGEPLANYSNVLTSLRVLLDDFGFGLSKRRVTVSTSGLVPFMDRLASDVDTALAVSLHAPNDAIRDLLVPINRKYPLRTLMAACHRYLDKKDRKAHITFEYVMLDGVNDQKSHACELVRLIEGMPAKVNLIPFNTFRGAKFQSSSEEMTQRFADTLRRKGVVATIRRTRGADIDAACGQLVGRVQSRQARRLSDAQVTTRQEFNTIN